MCVSGWEASNVSDWLLAPGVGTGARLYMGPGGVATSLAGGPAPWAVATSLD
jgi:hypothetical protein